MEVTLIAAMAKNRVIGKDNGLIWQMPADLKRFKKLTTGHHVIMGRKTYESMGKPLPHRVNIIVTRQENYQAPGCMVVHSLKEALLKAEGDSKPFVIGGAEIYKMALPYAHCIELTLVHKEFEGDSYFPEFSESEWKLQNNVENPKDEVNPYPFDYLTYLKQ